MTRWSLASRLTTAYVLAAFALLAGAMFVQFHTLERSLANEDDELIAERLIGDIPAPERPQARPSISGEAGPYARVLDAQCRVVRTEYAGPLPPPPVCDSSVGTRPAFRSWHARHGHVWRIASVRTADGWTEEMLDRRLDVGVVHSYRQVLSAILAATLALLAVLSFVIARRGLTPLTALAVRVAGVTPTSLDQRLGVDEMPAEIRPVAYALDGMLERLASAFRALSQSTADLAHEMRTPIHVLRQRAEVTLSRVRTPEEYREALRSTVEDLDRVGRMIDDMLFLARAEDPRASIERGVHPVAAELTAVAAFLEAVGADGGVTVAVNAPASLTVSADRMLLRRALVNVVTNSLRHTSPGGRVTLTGRADRDGVVIEVEDTGSGIPPQMIARVFDRHVRGSATRGATTTGSGLGLSIVRGIMQLHGGSAEASSVPGVGTRLTLRFPAARCEAPRAATTAPGPGGTGYPGGTSGPNCI